MPTHLDKGGDRVGTSNGRNPLPTGLGFLRRAVLLAVIIGLTLAVIAFTISRSLEPGSDLGSNQQTVVPIGTDKAK